MKLSKKRGILLIMAIFMNIIGVMCFRILRSYPIVVQEICLSFLIFFCVYKFWEVLLIAKRLGKVVAIEWFVYICFLTGAVLEEGQITSKVQVVFFFLSLIFFGYRVIKNYFNSTSAIYEMSIAIFILGVCIFFSATAAQFDSFILFCAFKFFALITITSSIKIIRHTNRAGGILIILTFYFVMLAVNGILNIKFLYDDIENGFNNFCIAIRDLYSIPKIADFGSSVEDIECLFSFIVYRVSEAIMMGGLVSIITDKDVTWTEKRSEKTCT